MHAITTTHKDGESTDSIDKDSAEKVNKFQQKFSLLIFSHQAPRRLRSKIRTTHHPQKPEQDEAQAEAKSPPGIPIKPVPSAHSKAVAL